ncbi:MAG: hypothetical protein WAK82_39025 [Streptosporangiaceae bacterium]
MRSMPGLLSRGTVPIAAAVLAVGIAGTAIALTRSAPADAASVATAGRSSAALKIASGTTDLQVRMARLGGTLLRVSTPQGGPVRPVLTSTRIIVLSLAGGQAQGPVTVVLNSAVTWSLDFAGGTQRTDADLRGGKLAGIVVSAGSDILDLSLPRPAGTLPFVLAGGVSQFRLSLPDGVPARVTVGGGASQVSDGDQNLTGVAGGTVISPPGWAAAPARFDIDAIAGFSRLTVSRWS